MELFRKKAPEQAAVIDLGSNSFHMIVANIRDGEIKIVDRLREPVRLSEGLDESSKQLSQTAKIRAIKCLERFSQRLQGMPAQAVRAVGTNTLRRIRNKEEFLSLAQELLGFPIEIISGIEEARLIYLGVSRNIPVNEHRRLVIDIGGGSTELIIGDSDTPLNLESLHMGCVSYASKFFPDGAITSAAIKKAELSVRVELEPIAATYKNANWQSCIGASGTIRAIRKVLQENNWCQQGISREALKKLRSSIKEFDRTKDLVSIKGLSQERAPVFPAGVAILYSIFKDFGIDHMDVSDSALREGLIFELIGRFKYDDIRGQSVINMAKRFHVDMAQAARIEKTAKTIVEQLTQDWKLDSEQCLEWLTWTAYLHEIGLDIAHSQYHKHGAYIVQYADLSGFSQHQQTRLALLVRSHRRKIPVSLLSELDTKDYRLVIKLIMIFRLCVVLHRSHSPIELPEFRITASDDSVQLKFPALWVKQHPLTRADFEQEAQYLHALNYNLIVA